MVSVVTYGRNDSHGYNLAKRAALSFNCIAEIMDDPDDEIIFVDCNSEDDYATFPESIADTLTAKARSVLRIYRIRRALYRERCRGTHLPVLESFSRNVALRRANPRNRWVLSTNPDMIFVPWLAGGLNALLQDLPDGYYATPRYELPETLWESFDRHEPLKVMADIKTYACDIRLHLAVRGAPWSGYDDLGDFQLMPRRHVLEVGGFHEAMVRGWHVDSNLAKRFSIFYGQRALSLHDRVFAYHLMHLRMLTSGHTAKALQLANSPSVFVKNVDSPVPKDQPEDWGAPDKQIEQILLVEKRRPHWLRARTKGSGPPPSVPEIEFTDDAEEGACHASCYASLERIQFYLANAFDQLPGGLRVGVWSGNQGFQDFMQRTAREKNWKLLLVSYSPLGEAAGNAEMSGAIPDICLFDFTLHFLPRSEHGTQARQVHGRFVAHLFSQFSALGDRVVAGNYQANPTLYCLGVTRTAIEGLISSITPGWDRVPSPLGYKRGRFSASFRNSRLQHFVTAQSARVELAAELRGRKTIPDKIALECLRFVRRFGAAPRAGLPG